MGRVAQSVQRLSYGLDGPGSNPGGEEIFQPSRPALRPTQSPVKWVPGLSPGVKCGRGVLLTTHPLLVPRSWKSRAIPLSPSGPHRACNGITLRLLELVWTVFRWLGIGTCGLTLTTLMKSAVL